MAESRVAQLKLSMGVHWRDVLFFLVTFLGVVTSLYLTIAHYNHLPLACAQNGLVDCAAVTQSAYAQISGTPLPVSAAGLGWFTVIAALRLARLRMEAAHLDTTAIRLAALSVGAAGIGFVLYLFYVELAIVHRICGWCTAAHVFALGAFLLTVADLQQD